LRVKLQIALRSLPMLHKFKKILKQSFARKVTIYKLNHGNIYGVQTSINKLSQYFLEWKQGHIPSVIKENPTLFGSYLAGLIDGDGYIHQKHNQDRMIPQLLIEISGPKPLLEIKECVEKFTHCKVGFRKRKDERCFETYFYVTHKNSSFIQKYILPHISLTYKKDLLYFHIQKIDFSNKALINKHLNFSTYNGPVV